MSCEDIPSLLDLQKAKKNVDDLGRLMGAGTGTSTNEVTGQVRPTYNAVMANLGYTRVGTFATGATLLNGRQTLLWDIADGGDGQEYGWSGSFLPSGKVVPPGSTPLTTGGIAVGAWMSRFDPVTRQQLREAQRRSYAEAGYNLVDGSFEAGGTLVNVNDVLLHEASGKAYSGPVGSVPAGTDPISGGFVDMSSALLRYRLLPSVAEMKVKNWPSGTIIETQGYYTPNDGGGALYEIYDTVPFPYSLYEPCSGCIAVQLVNGGRINIKSLGVASTPINDELKKAVEYIRNQPTGGTIAFPDGEYTISAMLYEMQCSNIVFELSDKAVLIADGGTVLGWYPSTLDPIAFKNVTLTGGTLRGVNGGYITLELVKVDGVVIKDATFIEFLTVGHFLDLGGAQNVIFENNTILGSAVTDRRLTEFVQVGTASWGGLAWQHGDPALYDDTPTRNVKYIGNTCKPYYDVSGTLKSYPPRPIGNHSTAPSGNPSDILIEGNLFDRIIPAVTGDASGGFMNHAILGIPGVQGVVIRNNRVVGHGVPTMDRGFASFRMNGSRFTIDGERGFDVVIEGNVCKNIGREIFTPAISFQVDNRTSGINSIIHSITVRHNKIDVTPGSSTVDFVNVVLSESYPHNIDINNNTFTGVGVGHGFFAESMNGDVKFHNNTISGNSIRPAVRGISATQVGTMSVVGNTLHKVDGVYNCVASGTVGHIVGNFIHKLQTPTLTYGGTITAAAKTYLNGNVFVSPVPTVTVLINGVVTPSTEWNYKVNS